MRLAVERFSKPCNQDEKSSLHVHYKTVINLISINYNVSVYVTTQGGQQVLLVTRSTMRVAMCWH